MSRTTFIGLLAALAVLLLALVFLTPLAKRHTDRINCGNQMVSIACAARLWADDNNGSLPTNWFSLSNELGNVRILFCPSDHAATPPSSWASFAESRCSYKMVSPGLPENATNNGFFRCRIHGFLAYPDGTVFDGRHRRTKIP
jgi:hypothetical protein